MKRGQICERYDRKTHMKRLYKITEVNGKGITVRRGAWHAHMKREDFYYVFQLQST